MRTEIKIIDYRPEHRILFKEMNQRWIEKYFKMEASDHKALDDPEQSVLKPGGAILVAYFGEEVAGICALVKLVNRPYDYELSKMAVDPNFQGKGVGFALAKAIEERAKLLGGKTLYIESNTVLGPAMRLYQKRGFVEIEGEGSPYERCNIYFVKEI